MKAMINLSIDNKEIEAGRGTNLLRAALDNDIYIPNLCYIEGMEKPPASCRLCLVEIEGLDRPVPSCSTKVKEGMKVTTDTPAVRRLQKTAFELLLSIHDIDCKNCPANKKCELQKIARFLHIPLKQKRIEYIERDVNTEGDHPFLKYDPHKCVMCGKCVYTCTKLYGSPYLSFAGRGIEMTISFFGETENIPCNDCYECVKVCPVGALLQKGGEEDSNMNPELETACN